MLAPIHTFKEKYGDIRYLLAPMAGITDIVFRSLMRKMGSQAMVSELISSEGLVRGGAKTRALLMFSNEERPIGIQIFGSNIETMSQAAKIVEQEGADFVDINFGCPVKKVVCDGGGAAWLKSPLELSKLLTEIKKSIQIPLTIKIRTGWDENTRNALEVSQIAYNCGVDWVAIHGRTRSQGYSGLSDWEYIKSISENSKIPIIGNGDILDAKSAIDKINNRYSHGVMIGRGALKNPWIFQEIMGHENIQKNFIQLILEHFDMALRYKERRNAYLSLKKFLGWYAAGLPNSSQFRYKMFTTLDFDELKQMSLEYFSSVEFHQKAVENEPFLMGGHG
jgi:nifR3 family TIM-barrel protein